VVIAGQVPVEHVLERADLLGEQVDPGVGDDQEAARRHGVQ